VKILNIEPENYSDKAGAILRTVGLYKAVSSDREELLKLIPEYEVLITRLGFQIDREVFNAASRLKVVASATTGLDHFDLECANELGIEVISLKGMIDFLRTIPATAEHTWALLMSLMRRIPWAYDSVRQGEWIRDNYRGRDLRGKRLGILGLGRVGEKVASYGLAFGMEIMAYDPYRVDVWPPGVQEIKDLKKLMSQTDILSIHVPLNDQTQNLVGKQHLELLPDGAVVINTSRGRVMDESALVSALLAGTISGAAIDVLYEERVENTRLTQCTLEYARSHHNLLITPHIAGATVESMHATEEFIATKIRDWIDKNTR
tara:strand:- start:480 stop:1436 length:957 start_codon:yes stop_codon:yes gene_type:complete